jgi:hypothetical protein
LAAGLVTLAYVALSVGHLIVAPVAPDSALNYANAPDEAAHRVYIAAIATGHRLPLPPHATGVGGEVRRIEDPRFPTYEWHQPPLYYLLAAPLHSLGIVGERALGVLIGAAGIWVIFLCARLLFPDDPPLAVVAMGFAALLPMRQAITAAVGNDGATELVFSLTALSLVAALRGGFTPLRAFSLGVCLVLALLTKTTGMLLVPVAAFALWRLRADGESASSIARGAGIVAAVVLAGASWWYLRNVRVTGEFLPMRAFRQEFAGTSRARDWIGRPLAVDPLSGELVPSAPMTRAGYVGLVAAWTARSFFAAYTPPRKAAIGAPVFLPQQFYWPYAAFLAVALAGLLRVRPKEWTPAQRSGAWTLGLIAVLVVGAFGAFAWEYFQATGRYLYPALLPISIAWALGFRRAIPQRRRDEVSIGALALMAVLAFAFLTAAVLPAYSSAP